MVPTAFSITIDGLDQGVLRGTLRMENATAAAAPPILCLRIDGAVIAEAQFGAREGVEVAFGAGLPASVLTEGIRIIEITPGREASAPVLARYPLIVGATGEAGGLALLGAEFEEFRRAFFDVLAEPPIPASERSVIVAEAGALMERMLGAMQSRVEAEFAALSRRIEALEEGRPPPPGRSAIRRTD